MRYRVLTFIAAALLVMAGAEDCQAGMSFYTNGGIVPMEQALSRVALVFADGSYRALIATLMALSIFGAAGLHYLKAFYDPKARPLAWAGPVGIGIVIYLGLFVRTADVTIYDEALGITSAQSYAIPEGIAWPLTTINRIEHQLIDIMSTAGDPGSYQLTAGGIGFQLLAGLSTIRQPNADAVTSMDAYVNDCVLFEATRPGGNLTMEDLLKPTAARLSSTEAQTLAASGGTATTIPSSPLLVLLSRAASESNFTTSAIKTTGDSLDGGKNTVSCKQAYGDLVTYFTTSSNFNDAVEGACASAAIAPNDIARCQLVLNSVAMKTLGSSINAHSFAGEAALASTIAGTLSKMRNGPLAAMQSNRQVAVAGSGMGVTATQWMPMARAVVTAIAVSLAPIVAIFVATPFCGAALTTLIGLFIWIACWGLCDTITHIALMDYAVHYFSNLATSEHGLQYYLNIPDSSTKMLAMFGYARTASMMLATVISGIIGKFGGYAIASLGNNLMGTVQGAGTSAAAAAFMPEGKSRTIETVAQAAATMENRAKFGNDSDYLAAVTSGQSLIGSVTGMRAAAASADTSVAAMSAETSFANQRTDMARSSAVNAGNFDANRYRSELETAGQYGSKEPYKSEADAMRLSGLNEYQSIVEAKATEKTFDNWSREYTEKTGKTLTEEQVAIQQQNWGNAARFGEMQAHAMVQAINGHLTPFNGHKLTTQQEQAVAAMYAADSSLALLPPGEQLRRINEQLRAQGIAEIPPNSLATPVDEVLKQMAITTNQAKSGIEAMQFDAMSEVTGKRDAFTFMKATGRMALSAEDAKYAAEHGHHGFFAGSVINGMALDENGKIINTSSIGTLNASNRKAVAEMYRNLAKTNKTHAKRYRQMAQLIESGKISGWFRTDGVSDKTGIGSVATSARVAANLSAKIDRTGRTILMSTKTSGYEELVYNTHTNFGAKGTMSYGGTTMKFESSQVVKQGNRYTISKAVMADGSIGSFSFNGHYDRKKGSYVVDRMLSQAFEGGFRLTAQATIYALNQGHLPSMVLESQAGRIAFRDAVVQDIKARVSIEKTHSKDFDLSVEVSQQKNGTFKVVSRDPATGKVVKETVEMFPGGSAMALKGSASIGRSINETISVNLLTAEVDSLIEQYRNDPEKLYDAIQTLRFASMRDLKKYSEGEGVSLQGSDGQLRTLEQVKENQKNAHVRQKLVGDDPYGTDTLPTDYGDSYGGKTFDEIMPEIQREKAAREQAAAEAKAAGDKKFLNDVGYVPYRGTMKIAGTGKKPPRKT